MKAELRQKWLAVAAAGCIVLLAVDRLVLSPLVRRSKAEDSRIHRLHEFVAQGSSLLAREQSIRGKWAEMTQQALPADGSAAEDGILKAAGRWARASGITLTSLTPQWREHEGGYRTLEYRAGAQGDLRTIARFLYELECDPAALRLRSCEIDAHDDKGRELSLNVRFSALRLPHAAGETP